MADPATNVYKVRTDRRSDWEGEHGDFPLIEPLRTVALAIPRANKCKCRTHFAFPTDPPPPLSTNRLFLAGLNNRSFCPTLANTTRF